MVRPLAREATQKERKMITKVKVKETKISVVMEDDALDALIAAVEENGLYVNKQAIKSAIFDLEANEDSSVKYIRQNVPLMVIDAAEYVNVFNQAAYNLYFSEIDRWEDGTPQIDFTRYFLYTYKFKLVAMVG